MNKALFLLLIVTLISCKTETRKHDDNKKNANAQLTTESDFNKFISLIPTIELPYKTSCDQCCPQPIFNSNDSLIEKYTPKGASISGLIQKNNDRAVILVTYPADELVPSVKVYDLNGKLTGEMDFMTGYCGSDINYWNKAYLTINKDITFQTVDSSFEVAMDTVTWKIIDTVNLEISRKEFFINSEGAIVEKTNADRR